MVEGDKVFQRSNSILKEFASFKTLTIWMKIWNELHKNM